MYADDLEACMVLAEESAFGGFSVWDGQAFFREPPGSELKAQLIQADDTVTFYLYERPDSSGYTAAQAACTGALQLPDQAFTKVQYPLHADTWHRSEPILQMFVAKQAHTH